MPSVLASILVAEALAHCLIPVEAQCFVEVFVGKALLTLAMVFRERPAIRPWDIKWGAVGDVQVHGGQLLRVAESGGLSSAHCATPCQSMSWARLPVLRTFEYPDGSLGLAVEQGELTTKGNELAAITSKFCMRMRTAGAFFSIENPWGSWLWFLECIRKLYLLLDVICIRTVMALCT